jgi:hypothetical protein
MDLAAIGPALTVVGYQGRRVARMVYDLTAARAEVVVDVRLTPLLKLAKGDCSSTVASFAKVCVDT